MIKVSDIANAMRKRALPASGMDASHWQFGNENYDAVGRGMWVAEYATGGIYTPLSPVRSRMSGLIIEYDVHCVEGSGFSAAEAVAQNIADEFSLDSRTKPLVSFTGGEGIVRSIKIENVSDKYYPKVAVVLTVDASTC